MSDIDEIQIPQMIDNCKHVYHQYVIRANNRDILKDYLYKNDIESSIYYPVPCHLQKPYLNQKSNNPKAETLADDVLSLPIAEHITIDNIKYIADTICKFYQLPVNIRS